MVYRDVAGLVIHFSSDRVFCSPTATLQPSSLPYIAGVWKPGHLQCGWEGKNPLQALQIQLLHPGLPRKEPKSVTTTHAFLQAGMAPGAVRQEPRQGRDQLGWLEQVLISTWRIHRVKISGPVFLGGDVPQGDVGASSSLVLGSSSHGETADGDCHRVADHC